ncbi:MAG: carbohydrate-binding protein, partial [Opitutales bacterium]
DVLASTSVVLPGKKATIIFDAPAQEGEYPYVCTFPGHGFVMYGTLFVAKERPQKMDQVLAKAATGTPTQIILATPATSATAIVHRTFMPDSSPAAIAVSLPGGHSYCWDAGNCRLRYVWRDGFIKKNGSFGRWRTLPTIEGRVYHREVGFPFRFSNRNGHDPKTSFKGYRIVGGIPEFHYHADEAEVTEFITKLPGKSGLIRRFHVKHAPGDLLFEIDPDAGVKTTCDKGRIEGNHLRLSPREAIQFTLTQRETPGKAPLLYLSMNDLAACYNRKGDLHEGAIGQSWRLNGGKSVTPAQTIGDYSQGSTLAAWVKLSDPKRSIPALFGWKKGGQVHYVPSRKSFSFGLSDAFEKQTANGLEAEQAKFKGPTRSSTQGGHLGDGYLDFGTQVGEFVEWTVKVDKAGPYTLRFRYASSADRPLKLSVDGKTDILSPTLPFKNSGGWSSWKYLDIKRSLASGNHLVRLTSVKPFGPNLDRLEILAPDDEKKNNPKTNQLSPPDDAPTIDDTWHFIAMSMDAQSIRLFVDGELHEERVRKIDSPSPEGLVTIGSSK